MANDTIAAYIEGINTEQSIDSAVQISAVNIPYQQLTDGELSIALAERQYNLYATKYPEMKAKADFLKQVLSSSLSGQEITLTTDRQLINWVRRKLSDNTPAIGAHYNSRIGIIETYEEYKQIEYAKCQEIKSRWSNTPWIRFAERNRLRKEWEQCFKSAQYVSLVNDKLEESGPHLLYHFKGRKSTVPIQTKRVLHNIALDNYSGITGLSKENLSLWIRNGIIAQNLSNGAGSKNPENTINYMLDNVRDGIGDPIVIVGIIISIFKLALAASQAIIARMNEQDRLKMLANTQGFESESFGPQRDDFLGNGQADILPLLLGGAAIFALSQ
jgi:hypothetical protein